jgi:hypothetical protein
MTPDRPSVAELLARPNPEQWEARLWVDGEWYPHREWRLWSETSFVEARLVETEPPVEEPATAARVCQWCMGTGTLRPGDPDPRALLAVAALVIAWKAPGWWSFHKAMDRQRMIWWRQDWRASHRGQEPTGLLPEGGWWVPRKVVTREELEAQYAKPRPPCPDCHGEGLLYDDSMNVFGVHGGWVAYGYCDCPAGAKLSDADHTPLDPA